jgi:hypothetical protein
MRKIIIRSIVFALIITCCSLIAPATKEVFNAVNKPTATIELLSIDPHSISVVWIEAPISWQSTINNKEVHLSTEVKGEVLILKFENADPLEINNHEKISKITFSGFENYYVYAQWNEHTKSWFVICKND